MQSAAEADAFADLALTAKDRARRSLLLEYESRFQSSRVSASTSTPPAAMAPAATAFHGPTSHAGDDDDEDGFDPYHHPSSSSGDEHDVDDDLARQVASLHAQIDHHLLLRRQVSEPTNRPRASILGLDHHLPRLRRTDRPVSCPPLASNPFSSLSSALALSATSARTRSAPTSSLPSPSLSSTPLRSPHAYAHAGDASEWRPPLPNQWSANVFDDLDFLDTAALPVAAAAGTSGPSSPATEAEDPLIRLARDTGPPSPTLSVMSSLAFELAGALGHDPPLVDTASSPTSPTALAFDESAGVEENDDNDGLDPRTVPLVAHRTVLDSDTVVTTYAYPQHTNAKRASYMSTTASAAAIARNSVLSTTGQPGSRRASSAMGGAGHVRTDRRPSSMFSTVSGAQRHSAAQRSATHSVRGSVFIDTNADVIVSTSSASASVRGSFMEMRANMEMDVLADDPDVFAYASPTDVDIIEDEEVDDDVLDSVKALTRWSHRFSVPPNPFEDPDEDPLTNPAAWTQGEAHDEEEEQEQERRRTNASLDALAAMRDNEDVHQGTNHAMLRLMGIRDAPPPADDGYDPDDPHAAILDPTELGVGLGASLAQDRGGGLSLEEELADAELKRFSTMLDRVASQIEDLRVADTKLTASLEKVCARCRMIQTAGPGVREYLDPCEVHGMPEEVEQAPSR